MEEGGGGKSEGKEELKKENGRAFCWGGEGEAKGDGEKGEEEGGTLRENIEKRREEKKEWREE